MNSTVAFRQLEDIIELKNERIKSLEAKVNENQSLRETLEKVTNQLLKAQEEIEQLRARFLAQSTGTRKGMDQLQNKMHITASKGSKVRIEQEQYFASKIPM